MGTFLTLTTAMRLDAAAYELTLLLDTFLEAHEAARRVGNTFAPELRVQLRYENPQDPFLQPVISVTAGEVDRWYVCVVRNMGSDQAKTYARYNENGEAYITTIKTQDCGCESWVNLNPDGVDHDQWLCDEHGGFG